MKLTVPLLVRNHGFVELHFVGITDNLFVLSVIQDDTCITPTELVHAPERVQRQEETVNRVSKRTSEKTWVLDVITHEMRYTTIHPTSMNSRLTIKMSACKPDTAAIMAMDI